MKAEDVQTAAQARQYILDLIRAHGTRMGFANRYGLHREYVDAFLRGAQEYPPIAICRALNLTLPTRPSSAILQKMRAAKGRLEARKQGEATR